MGSFCRVEGEKAGPDALGILVPPAKRTIVVLRPRGLPWDAVLCRSADDASFVDLAHDEASAAAQSLYRALRVEPTSIEWLAARLRVVIGGFVFIVCPRLPGQPYVPLSCTEEESAAIRDRLLTVLCPVGEQEVYFNMRFFER